MTCHYSFRRLKFSLDTQSDSVETYSVTLKERMYRHYHVIFLSTDVPPLHMHTQGKALHWEFNAKGPTSDGRTSSCDVECNVESAREATHAHLRVQ